MYLQNISRTYWNSELVSRISNRILVLLVLRILMPCRIREVTWVTQASKTLAPRLLRTALLAHPKSFKTECVNENKILLAIIFKITQLLINLATPISKALLCLETVTAKLTINSVSLWKRHQAMNSSTRAPEVELELVVLTQVKMSQWNLQTNSSQWLRTLSPTCKDQYLAAITLEVASYKLQTKTFSSTDQIMRPIKTTGALHRWTLKISKKIINQPSLVSSNNCSILCKARFRRSNSKSRYKS